MAPSAVAGVLGAGTGGGAEGEACALGVTTAGGGAEAPPPEEAQAARLQRASVTVMSGVRRTTGHSKQPEPLPLAFSTASPGGWAPGPWFAPAIR
jgi:hypothetical protein